MTYRKLDVQRLCDGIALRLAYKMPKKPQKRMSTGCAKAPKKLKGKIGIGAKFSAGPAAGPAGLSLVRGGFARNGQTHPPAQRQRPSIGSATFEWS